MSISWISVEQQWKSANAHSVLRGFARKAPAIRKVTGLYEKLKLNVQSENY